MVEVRKVEAEICELDGGHQVIFLPQEDGSAWMVPVLTYATVYPYRDSNNVIEFFYECAIKSLARGVAEGFLTTGPTKVGW
jgi:hypothetical protein